MNVIYRAGAISIVVFLIGCSTIQSKWGMGPDEPHQNGHLYSGLTHNIGSWCDLSNEKIGAGMKTFYFFFYAIDFPLSLLADTVFVPVDLVVKPMYRRLSSKEICEAHSDQLD